MRKIPLSTIDSAPPAAARPMPGAATSAMNSAAANTRNMMPTTPTGNTASPNIANKMNVNPSAPPTPRPGVASS